MESRQAWATLLALLLVGFDVRDNCSESEYSHAWLWKHRQTAKYTRRAFPATLEMDDFLPRPTSAKAS
jgi:hypothetical protein